MMREVDRSKTSKISFDDFIFALGKRSQDPHSAGDTEKAFKLFDSNGDGLISPADIKAMLDRFGEVVTDKEVELIVSELDSDGDGQLHYQDFVKMMGGKP